MIDRSLDLGVGAHLRGHLLQAGTVHLHGVREDRDDDVVLVHLVVPGHLDRHGDVGRSGDAHQVQALDVRLLDPDAPEVLLPYSDRKSVV